MFINNFDPVALEIFSLEVRWYSLAYIFGIILGWILAKKLFIQDIEVKNKFDDYLTYLIIGIILGGRLGYIFIYNLSFYVNNPLDIFKIWQGGMSFHGGLIGVIFVSIIFAKKNNQNLNEISKSSAAHSTLIIDDNSSCKFIKKKDKLILKTGLKITQKNSVYEQNYWKINAAHDGYFKKFKSIHERNIEFFPEQMKFIGNDKIIRKKNNYNFKFDIRFHLEPNIKLMKTQDNKSILIELKDEGWKFTCDNYEINIDNGLYFGNKNSYIENQNIFVSGILNNNEENVKWEIKQI